MDACIKICSPLCKLLVVFFVSIFTLLRFRSALSPICTLPPPSHSQFSAACSPSHPPPAFSPSISGLALSPLQLSASLFCISPSPPPFPSAFLSVAPKDRLHISPSLTNQRLHLSLQTLKGRPSLPPKHVKTYLPNNRLIWDVLSWHLEPLKTDECHLISW